MVDHFLDPGTTLDDFARCSYKEVGDFVGQPYTSTVEHSDNRVTVLLWREGHVKSRRKLVPIRVGKELSVAAGSEEFFVRYELTNLGDAPVRALFASEWNINLLGGAHNEDAFYETPSAHLDDWHLDSFGELFDIDELRLGNRRLGIKISLKLSEKARLWRFPVEALSSSEGGIEKVYQGSCILPIVPLTLAPGASYRLELVWSVL